MNSLLNLSPGSRTGSEWPANALSVLVAGAVLRALFRPSIRRGEAWKAVSTPLASIFGSGFVVVAPLLGALGGRWALLAIAGRVLLVLLVGGAIGPNIAHVETAKPTTRFPASSLMRAGRCSSWPSSSPSTSASPFPARSC